MYDSDLLSSKLSPYLLPFIVEFVLIGAATLYKIMNQIGMPVTQKMLDVEYIPMSEKIKLMAKRTLVPNIIGLVILLVTTAGTVYIIYTTENAEATQTEQEYTAYTYFFMQIVLNIVGIFSILLASFYKFDAPFTGHAHSTIDEALLIVTLFGFYLLLGFNILPNIESFSEANFSGTLAKMGVFENLFNYVQGSMQFLFIMDGMRRGAQPMWTKDNITPAFFVTILFFVNLGLWLISSFLIKETSQSPLMMDYYGSLTWNIVLYITLPLAVFFRFHSTICIIDILIDIWMPDKLNTN